jgi:poly-gamma-glutamate capsule biosynthesis protein CapA/YwtB (metallophosphatase superfamily)
MIRHPACSLVSSLFLVPSLCFGLLFANIGWAATASPSVTVTFVGDIMLDGLPGKAIKQGRDPFAPFSRILADSDIRIGNLECVIATKGTPEDKPFTFRAHPRAVRVLTRHFDAVSVANNHTGDFGPAAFAEMLDLLDRHGLPYFGGGRNLASAHSPLLMERNGLKIAFLAYNEFFPRGFEADFDTPGLAWSEDEQVRADIQRARTQHGAELVIPFMHWGLEHEPLASARQRQLARLMIDAGADAVVGAHPHVTQNVEQYKGKPIIYSLGNFVFDGFSDEDNNTGWLLRLELDREGVRRWRTYIARINREGIPFPAPPKSGSCWERGQDKEVKCDASNDK